MLSPVSLPNLSLIVQGAYPRQPAIVLRAPPEAQASSPSARHWQHYSSRLSERVRVRGECGTRSREAARTPDRTPAGIVGRGGGPTARRPPTRVLRAPPAAGARPSCGSSAARSPPLSACRRCPAASTKDPLEGIVRTLFAFLDTCVEIPRRWVLQRVAARAFPQVTRIPLVVARAFCPLRPPQTSEFRRKCPFFADLPARRPLLPPGPPRRAAARGAVAAAPPGGGNAYFFVGSWAALADASSRTLRLSSR